VLWKRGLKMAERPQTILEPGGTEVSTAAGGARRYRKPLKNFCWRDIRDILEDSAEEWSKHNAPRLGAALSFYTLLSLAPLLLVTVSVVSVVMGRDAAVTGIVSQLKTLGGAEASRTAQALLSSPRSSAHGVLATILGLITLLFGASGVMVELRDALNYIWDVPAPELSGMKRAWSFVKDRLFSFALVLAVGFLLVVSLAISAWIAALGTLSAHYLPINEALLHAANFILSFVIITALFAAIYKFLPNARIEWRDVILGGAVTSVLFSLGKLGLGIYLGKAGFVSAYGAAASVVALIVWVYYSAQIFFLGAEFTHVFANRHGSRPADHPQGMVVESEPCAPASTPTIVTPADAAQEKTGLRA
jgi:membrane protein